MTRKLLIHDLTLRDGQQSVFAARMSQAQIDCVSPYYKDAGFYVMEVWGGAVSDPVMCCLGKNPWNCLEIIKEKVGNSSKLSALSCGCNLFGYNPYSDEIMESLCRNLIRSGIDIMRIFDALNNMDNVKSTIRYVKKFGGKADCVICYTIDPHHSLVERIETVLHGRPLYKPVFMNEYFLNKVLQLESLGVDTTTLKDMSGSIPPARAAESARLFKKSLKAPVDLHTHCTPGYGLASVVSAIINGVDTVGTNIRNFTGGPAASVVELVYIFCKKLGTELSLNMDAIAKINKELLMICKELSVFGTAKKFPRPFSPVEDSFPAEIDRFSNDAIEAVWKDKEDDLLFYCRAIEEYFDFPEPNKLVKKAQIPGGMYVNMVAQLKQLGQIDPLEKVMPLIPQARMDAGLPPLVTPMSQIIGAQAVPCALDELRGRPMYSNPSNQLIALVKREYGKTPIPVDPAFWLKIVGVQNEVPHDGSHYVMQENPVLEDLDMLSAEDEKEILLLELFPTVARTFLTKWKEQKTRSTV